MKNRKFALLVGVFAMCMTALAFPVPTSQAQAVEGKHQWFFGAKWTTNAEGQTIAHRVDSVLDPSLDAQLVTYNGGTVGLVPKNGESSYAAAFPKPVPNLDNCKTGSPAEPWNCELANFEIDDATGALNPGSDTFRIKAEVRITPDEVTSGMNIFQRGGFEDAQYKMQVDNGVPSCRWSDGDNEIFITGTTNFNTFTDDFVVIECRKFSSGNNAKYKILVNNVIERRCERTNGTVENLADYECNPGANRSGEFEVLGDINPPADEPIYVGGLERGSAGNEYVNDPFTGDIGFVEMKIG